MTTDAKSEAEAEYERIRTKYAPARPRDLLICALLIGLAIAASILRHANWSYVLLVIVWAAFWEFTKFRLRRNAHEFAESAR